VKTSHSNYVTLLRGAVKEPHGQMDSQDRLGHLSLPQIKELREQTAKRRRRASAAPLVPQVRANTVPLSYAQERLWFLDQLGLVGPAYNMSMAYRLDGRLDAGALEYSFTELTRRHESLRTHFQSADGRAIQIVDPPGPFTLEVRDLSELPEDDKGREMQKLSSEEAQHCFDLARGPLLRASLLKLEQQQHVLMLTMHHIVSDGWSLAVLHRELGALYRAYSQGDASPFLELPVQYADYAIWQRGWLDGEVLRNQLQYWRERLHDAPPHLQIPTDRPRPPVASFKGALLNFELPAALCGALEDLARTEGATLFMVVLAAFQLLLSRYSGQQDVIVGSGVAGRTHVQTENLIGFFVNMLILRTDLSGNPSFRELLGRAKEVTMAAYAHQDLPFEKLVMELRPDRDLTRQPIFQVALALQNFPQEKLELPGLTWTPIDVDPGTALFDLTLHLFETSNGLGGLFEYATDLFDRGTIERMAEHFRILLESIVAYPERSIQQVQWLGNIERARMLQEFNNTSAPRSQDRLVHELFEEYARKAPETAAVVCGDQQLTYDQLNRRANQVAHALLTMGIRPDDRVALHAERSMELLVGLLGILKSGGAYVPLDVTYPPERLAYMLEDSAPVVVLTQQRLKGNLPATKAQIVTLDAGADGIRHQRDDNPNASRNGLSSRNLAYVIYTSGSTGTPKGVMVEHRNLVNLMNWHWAAFDLGAGCRCSSIASVGFDAAGWEIWPPLGIGATLVLVPPEASGDVGALLNWWANEELDVSFLPTPMAELAFSRNLRNKNLRALLVGGDQLRYRAVSQPFSLINNYGPTETTVVATSGRISDSDKVLHIGRPIANTQIHILDETGQLVPIGVVGEIYVGGDGVARGYLNRPELTAERFLPDPFSADSRARMYRTGDMGRWLPDGTVEYLGRNDHQVKIRGFRIELGEIESQLLQLPLVREAVVTAPADESGEKRLVAYVTANYPQVNASAREGSEKAGAEIVDHWKRLYEETYAAGATAPSFVGWNSSYTGQPIPESQMQEWLDSTVARISALRPRKMLEIGCGVGLLVQHLAPQCDKYVGTDISTSALENLRQWVSRKQDLEHVELLCRSATDLQDMEAGAFDTIVLNSVAQYFPDIDYLLDVLKQGLRLLAPGGKIFVGDIRNLRLLTMFHGAVQLSKAAATVSVGQLRKRISRAVAQEKELLIDPQFFHALPERLVGITSAEVQLKRGEASNELTRYRYDVVLYTGEHIIARPVYASVDWQTAAWSGADLETVLSDRRWRAVRVSSIPNSRLVKEAAALRLIERSEERLEAGVLRRQLNELEFEDVEPETVWKAGETHDYEVQVTWGAQDSLECFEAHMLDRTRSDQVPRVMGLEPVPQAQPWSAYANAPLDNSLRQQLIPQLREYLKGRLPEYMVPSAWVVLRQLPLTPHGKLDRHALPVPESRSDEMGEYVQPRTELERALADIWAQVLRVDQVGIHDNFFELGGHSLLATQVAARIGSSFSMEMPMRLLFEFPTIRQLSTQVDDLRRGHLVDELASGGNDIKELLQTVASMPETKVRELMRDLRGE
jgi:amino acid adenylation domain-containing protein